MKIKNKIVLSYITAVLLLIAGTLLFHEHHLNVFPKGEISLFQTENDSIEGGTSTSEKVISDSLIKINFTLHSGISFPKAGIIIGFSKNFPTNYIDFSAYDSLSIKFKTDRMDDIKVGLRTNDPKYTNPNKRLTERYLTQIVPATRNFTEQHLAISNFKISESWFTQNGFDTPDNLKYLNRGISMDISNGPGTLLGIPNQIEIKDIHFFGKKNIFIKFIIILFSAITALCILLFVIFTKKVDRKNGEING